MIDLNSDALLALSNRHDELAWRQITGDRLDVYEGAQFEILNRWFRLVMTTKSTIPQDVLDMVERIRSQRAP